MQSASGDWVGTASHWDAESECERHPHYSCQVTWNAEIFYRQPRWEVQVNFFNFADQHNFTVIDPTFTGNDAILEQMPFHVSVTLKLKF